MQYVFMKQLEAINDSTPLHIHFGIFRTGSSTARQCIKRHCNISGKKWHKLDPTLETGALQEQINDAHFLLVEHPFAAHLLTQRKVHYYTTIRNPIDQLISLYYWQQNREGRKATLEQFIFALPDSMNIQCRWFAALEEKEISNTMKSQHSFIDNNFNDEFYHQYDESTLLHKAMSALENRIDLIAPLEYLTEFVFALADKTDMPLVPVMERVNYSLKPEQFRLHELSEAAQEKMLKATALDQKIYEQVKTDFAERAQQIRDTETNYNHYYSMCSQLQQVQLASKGLLVAGNDIIHRQSSSPIPPLTLPQEMRKHFVEAEDFMGQHEHL